MLKVMSVIAVLISVCMVSGLGAGQVPQQKKDTMGQIQKGEYLVKHVAMCVQCHTPRDDNGELDQIQLLQGARVPVSAPFPNQHWAFQAPQIAGLPSWTEEDAIRLLQTGKNPNGYSPRPPMLPFRMTREDAAAVVAYLKSLPGGIL